MHWQLLGPQQNGAKTTNFSVSLLIRVSMCVLMYFCVRVLASLFVAAVAALHVAVADSGLGQALAQGASVATAVGWGWHQRSLGRIALRSTGLDVAVYPVHVVGHLGVHSWPVCPGTPVAIAGHSVQVPGISVILKRVEKST